MDNLDSALDELGMLSSVTCYKLDYLKVGSGEFEEKHLLKNGAHLPQAVEARAEIRKARERSCSVPVTMKSNNSKDRDEEENDLLFRVKSNYVTNIAIRSSPNMPDLSPYMKRKLQIEVEEKRYRDHRNDLAAYVSPRRCRNLVRSIPYYSPNHLRPAMAPISSVLLSSSSRHRTVGRLGRGHVRFDEPAVAGVHTFPGTKTNSMYALDEDITTRFSTIQLASATTQDKVSGSQTVKDMIPDLSSLSLSRKS